MNERQLEQTGDRQFAANRRRGLIWGVVLIAIGSVFLLDRLDWLPDRPWSFWPLFPVLIGLGLTISARDWEGRKGGLITLGIGLWLWANEEGWGDLTWRSSWPLLLIGFGALSVFEALAGLGKRSRGAAANKEKSHE